MTTLRPYQKKAVDAIFEEWKENNSTLAVLPTGCGKTQIFSEVIKRNLPNRSIVLVHREELAWQAVKRIESLGVDAQVEMANFRAENSLYSKAQAVVTTVQTQITGRMMNFKPGEFGILIADECHHSTSDSWKNTINYYRQNPNLKVLGVTATPDRADEEALGQVFESVAFDYEISDAIQDGWLVPIKQSMVNIESLDFSDIKTTAGDLNSGELAEVMENEKNLHGVVSASIEIIKERRSLVFAVTVKQAEMYANIFNRHKSGMADWVCGKTNKEDRRQKLKDFDEGKIQVMVNVGVLTEGYDSPGVECIIQARPTKSRALYSQMVGRSTRPLPGIVDLYETPEERCAAIAASKKPSCLVIDFVGNSGRHKLVTTADILGGNYTDEEIERAEKIALEGQETDTTTNLKKARADLAEEERARKEREEAEKRRIVEAARKAGIKAKASYVVSSMNPFDVFEIQPERERGWDNGKTLSEKQRAVLLKSGIDISQLSYHQSKQILNEQFRRWKGNLATFKQCKLLKKHGYETKDLTMKDASNLIDSLAKNGWNRQRAEASKQTNELILDSPF